MAPKRTATKTEGATTTNNVQRTALLNQQDVTLRQSQALAQIYVHASISAIAWIRDLFHDDAFVCKSSHDLLDLKDYEDYVQNAQRLAQIPPEKQDRTRAGYETLVSGRLSVVDEFLEQLKQAFTAVQEKLLSSLVISVCLDKDHPENVLESYVFTFSYRESAIGMETIENVALSGTAKSVTFGRVKTSLTGVLKQINGDLREKPQLPTGHCLHVRLIYNDDWDGRTSYPAFTTDETPHRFAKAAGWERTTKSWIFDAGYRGVSLAATRLKPEDGSGIEDDVEADIPTRQLTYEDLDTATLVDRTLDKRLDDKRRDERASQPETSARAKKPKPDSQSQQEQQGAGSAVSQMPSQITSQMSTQHREDFTTRQHLDAKLNAPPQLTKGGDTQLLVKPSSKIKFADRVLKALNRSGLEHHPSPKDGEVVCECGYNDDASDLLKCAYCKQYQHLTCYGYIGPDDGRIPDVHLCYTCLLIDEEAALLIDLRSKASLRRATKAMMGGKLHSEPEIAKAIGCPPPYLTTGICDQLIQEGFITRANKSNGFRLDLIEAKKQELLEYLFDPSSMITHHLAIPSETQFADTVATEEFTVPGPVHDATQRTPGRSTKRKASGAEEERKTPLSKRLRVRTERGVILNANRAYVESEDEEDPDAL